MNADFPINFLVYLHVIYIWMVIFACDLHTGHTLKPTPIKEVDLDSVKTEDIATEFMKTIPTSGMKNFKK